MSRPPLEMDRFARDAAEDDANGRERIVDSCRGWVADLVRALANGDSEAIRLLLAGMGEVTAAKVLLLADIAAHGDPRLVEEATGRRFRRAA